MESLVPMRLTKRGRVPGAPIYSSPYPLSGSILETLIHISHLDQYTPEGLGLELFNVVDS
jgi:hypothetical protein